MADRSTTLEGARIACEVVAQFGLTASEAAAAIVDLARIARPIFIQSAREAWPTMTPERQRLMAWIWEDEDAS